MQILKDWGYVFTFLGKCNKAGSGILNSLKFGDLFVRQTNEETVATVQD